MDKNEILLKETGNDGKTVFLFYDNMVGVYLAFGLSAYYATMVTDPFMSYSEETGMPVALLTKENILYLRQSMIKKEHQQKSFYRFEMRMSIGDEGYERWAKKICSVHGLV